MSRVRVCCIYKFVSTIFVSLFVFMFVCVHLTGFVAMDYVWVY